MPAEGEIVTIVAENGEPLETIPGSDAFHRILRTSSSGGSPTVGTTIGPTPADTAVGIGLVVALPAILPTSRRIRVQNTGPAGSEIRIREAGGVVGAGTILLRFGVAIFGGSSGALAALEVEEVAGIATTVSVVSERD